MYSTPLSPVCSLCSIRCLPQPCYCQGPCSCSHSASPYKVRPLLRVLQYHHHGGSPSKSVNGLVTREKFGPTPQLSHLHLPPAPPHSPLHKHLILARHYSPAPARPQSFQPYTFPPQTLSFSRSHSLAVRMSVWTAVPCCSRLQAHLVQDMSPQARQASWPY